MAAEQNNLQCAVTGFEFLVSIGVNGHDREDALNNLKKITSEFPCCITSMTKDDVDTYNKLIEVLSKHCGETGENEGAFETFNRLLKKVKKHG
ncbi:MAG TPA: hypothetical protein ENI23_01560 [bacterium]|nr:hypothetical protein [bacterium]